MNKNKHSIVHDVHVNAVLNQITDRLFDTKVLVDDQGRSLSDKARREIILAFKQSVRIRL